MLVIAFFCATAQNDTSTTLNKLEDVVVTGQYGETSLTRSVYKVKIIEAKRIEQQGAFNLKHVLQNELNVRINNDPALGSSMSIQGLSGQNIKILIDGVPVIGREGGSIDLTQINLTQIERIEFVEGPMSVNFGTDALGGVINLISKKSQTKQFNSNVRSYNESIGQHNLSAGTSLANDKWNLQAGLSRNFFAGYHSQPDTRFKTWKPREQYMGDLNFGYMYKRSSVRLQNSYFQEKVTNKGIGSITPWYAYAQDQYYHTKRITSSMYYSHKFENKKLFDWVISYSYYQRIRNTYRKDLVSLRENLIPSDEMNDSSYTRYWMSRGTYSSNETNKRFNYQLGYEINDEIFTGNRIQQLTQRMTDVNAFASSELKLLKKLVLRPAVRLIYNSQFQAPIVPSLNLKWDMRSNIIIRASYGRGFRAPSLKELYLDFVDPSHNVQGNPALKAEVQDNYQLTTTYEWKKLERVFRFEPSLYYNHIQNRIDLMMLNTNTLEAQYVNINEFQSAGINFNTEYRAPNYSLVLGYAYNGVNNSWANTFPTNQFFFSHETRFNINYTFKKPAITLSSFYRYNSRFQMYQFNLMTGNNELGYIEGYGIWDITIQKYLFGKKLSLTTGVKNILNVENVMANMPGGIHASQNNAAMIGMGRSLFLSIIFEMNWLK
jgi:outer membrane receptor for ferrienterochelin and colicins